MDGYEAQRGALEAAVGNTMVPLIEGDSLEVIISVTGRSFWDAIRGREPRTEVAASFIVNSQG